MNRPRFYFANRENIGRYFNRWDLLLLILILSLLFFLGFASTEMATPYKLGNPLPISLSPKALPIYALRTVLRMFIALAASIIFTFVVGTLAAKSRRAEQLIIPAIDVLQSVPVLSFLSITVAGFIHLFPNSLLGPECACIFAIFTAQVWNIIFGFYQALKTIPHDLKEVSAVFQLSAWQRFWKLEVPFSMSSLVWNMMMSMSASWFFVVLSEAISVAHQNIRLPGIGSYIAVAIEQRNGLAVFYAILTMMIIIFLYDQILFRPLIAWSEKFKMESSPDEEESQSWFIDLVRGSQLTKRLGPKFSILKEKFVNLSFMTKKTISPVNDKDDSFKKTLDWLWNGLLLVIVVLGFWFLLHFILEELAIGDILHVLLLGAATGTRVIVLIILSSLFWIPVGVWIGLRPGIAQKIQPIIQFAAAFPANLFYPIFVVAIVTFHLNVEIWVNN